MGLGFPQPTTIVAADVNCHNYDASIGQKTNSESLAVTLSTEQDTPLQAIATALGASAGGFNEFGDAPSTPDSTWTTVVSKSVLTGETMTVDGFKVWGDSDAEWSLEKTSGQIGGTRTSPSHMADNACYEHGIKVVGPDTVTIKVRHWYVGKTINFYANLEGAIV
jgi:hypothetical protein